MKRFGLVFSTFIVAAFSLFIFAPQMSVSAETVGACTKVNSFFGIPVWYKYLPLDSNCEVITTDLDGSAVLLIILAIVEILLFIAGFLAGFFIIYGAFKFITSQGDSAKVVSARTTVANAIVGLLIAVIASRVVAYIGGRLAAANAKVTTETGILDNANIPNAAANTANLADILSFVFGLAGAIALLIITVAGFRFITSQGEPAKVATARMTILYAVVGLIICVFSFTIVKFVLGRL